MRKLLVTISTALLASSFCWWLRLTQRQQAIAKAAIHRGAPSSPWGTGGFAYSPEFTVKSGFVGMLEYVIAVDFSRKEVNDVCWWLRSTQRQQAIAVAAIDRHLVDMNTCQSTAAGLKHSPL